MGVDYTHYLIPNPNAFVPPSVALASFLTAGCSEGWLREPGWIAKALTAYKSDRIRLAVSAAGSALAECWGTETKTTWPLWWPSEEAWHDLEIHVAQDYVYHTSELICPFASTHCGCGEQLEYRPELDVFFASRLRSVCPKCRNPFDVSQIPAPTIDGWTGEKAAPIPGGATYRFALLIHPGKVREQDQNFVVDPEFLSRCESHFACTFHGIGDLL